MYKNFLFDPEIRNWSVSEMEKKILTYVQSWDDCYFDHEAYRNWYEATHWKKLGLAAPPIYSMYGKLDDGIHAPHIPCYSISEKVEQIADRILLW